MRSGDIIHERTAHQVLRKKAQEHGNRSFLYCEDQVFSYLDIDRESDKVAAGLQSLGIVKGDKIGIIMSNRPEFLFLWFGLCKLGAIEVPINTAHRGDLLTYMLDNADCRIVVVESPFMDRMGPVLKDLPKVEKLLLFVELGETLPRLEKPTLDWREVFDNDGKFEEVEVLWSDPVGIMFTSGTTGPSKGVVMPHNEGIHVAEICCEAVQYDEKDCLYTVLPLFHVNAQWASIMPALMCGGRVVLAERFSASRFWPDVKKYGCTTFNYIGSILPILLKAEPKPDDADNPLRVLFGAGLMPSLFQEIETRFGVTVIEGYGMSEVGMPLMNTLKERKIGTCGKPRPNYFVKLVDDNGRELGPHVPGELLLRPLEPYCILLEYYKMPEKTVEAWRDLWFHTGDCLAMDEDGYFNFIDRKKDALRRRGENISSYEVEKVVNSHPAVLESAAVAAKSELGEDEVMICVALRQGKTVTPEALLEYCQERMAYFMIPRFVRFLERLPKTPTERIQKFQLREEGITSDAWDREKEGYKLRR
jgi:crotonobetaine/carnitine-CoA ligase